MRDHGFAIPVIMVMKREEKETDQHLAWRMNWRAAEAGVWGARSGQQAKFSYECPSFFFLNAVIMSGLAMLVCGGCRKWVAAGRGKQSADVCLHSFFPA